MKKFYKIMTAIGLAIVMAVTPVSGTVMNPQMVSAAQSKSLAMALGDRLHATFGTNTKYRSENRKVVTVDAQGYIEAVGTGKTRVIMTSGSFDFVYNIKVTLTGSSQYDKKVKALAAKLVKKNMSDAQKVKVVHDYIIKNTAYDSAYVTKDGGECYTAAGLLKNKTAVCEGYAKTFMAFMYVLGIPCKMVVGYGNSGSHGWNIVKINGKWFHIDVTWDDPLPDKKGRVNYTYFLLTDQEIAKDHVIQTQGLPACKTSGDKYISLFAGVCKNRQQMKERVQKALSNGKKEMFLAIKIDSGVTVDDVFDEIRQIDTSSHSFSYSTSVKGNYTLLNLKLT